MSICSYVRASTCLTVSRGWRADFPHSQLSASPSSLSEADHYRAVRNSTVLNNLMYFVFAKIGCVLLRTNSHAFYVFRGHFILLSLVFHKFC